MPSQCKLVKKLSPCLKVVIVALVAVVIAAAVGSGVGLLALPTAVVGIKAGVGIGAGIVAGGVAGCAGLQVVSKPDKKDTQDAHTSLMSMLQEAKEILKKREKIVGSHQESIRELQKNLKRLNNHSYLQDICKAMRAIEDNIKSRSLRHRHALATTVAVA